MTISAADAIRRSPLGHGLSPVQVDAIASIGTVTGFTGGESLANLNEVSADLFVVVEGRVQFLTHDADLVGEVSAGGLVGELSFVDGRIQPTHAVAAGYVQAVRFPVRELRALMVRDKGLGFLLLANVSIIIAHRLRMAIGALDDLMDRVEDVWTNTL